MQKPFFLNVLILKCAEQVQALRPGLEELPMALNLNSKSRWSLSTELAKKHSSHLIRPHLLT